MNLEYLMYPFIINSIPHLKTGNIYIDTYYFQRMSIFFIYNNRSLSKNRRFILSLFYKI